MVAKDRAAWVADDGSGLTDVKVLRLIRTVGYGLLLLTGILLLSLLLRARWGDAADELRLVGQVVTLVPNALIALVMVFWSGDAFRGDWESSLMRGIRRLLPAIALTLLLFLALVISDGVRLSRERSREIVSQVNVVRQRLDQAEQRMARVSPERWRQLQSQQAALRPDLRSRDVEQTLRQEIGVVRDRLNTRAEQGRSQVLQGIWSDVGVVALQLLVSSAIFLLAWRHLSSPESAPNKTAALGFRRRA